jgi:peptide/nickel transport system ATP-binding protein
MLIRIDKLQIEFRGEGTPVAAVDGVSFEINRGETFCLVGETGSGKSITALSIMRLLPASATQSPASAIVLSDDDQTSLDLTRIEESSMQAIRGSRIAMIFQEPMTSLNPVFTIGEQIAEAIELTWPSISPATARQQTLETLKKVKLDNPEQRIDEYPHRLSGGQRQRVMIAMALACEPDLLIADEPTTALDVTIQAEILKLMHELQQRTRMSILFITHDLGVVAHIADRVAVMQNGKIVELGPADSVLRDPQHWYTKSLLASLPGNLRRESRHSGTANQASQIADQRSLLCVEDLRVYYPIRSGLMRRISGYVKAVDGVSLSIERGQIVALVGESGCGKTTLGRALLRLVKPGAGSIYFQGEDLTQVNPARLKQLRSKLQYIFQDPASSLNPRLSVATTLVEPMAVHSIGDSHEHRLQLAENALRDVQLEPRHLWRFPHQFSGGQKQRIGIARALCLNPDFIVCDEITSSLDVSVQAGILKLLLLLRKQRNIALLFITHDIGVVEYISDKTAVMHRGRIIEVGDTARVCGYPENPYTRRLIAAVPRVNSVS